ncbi:uncharacterized protein LOC117123735 [Anneissia japonica]|uniref:uncharacterized protein LOC117123735 n=1 Tax=Anneissia japonica TaxID=1529436 RepID=UPI0014254E9F|nr:uncharacterized protein LOC117123735 [Anneissia japonica]
MLRAHLIKCALMVLAVVLTIDDETTSPPVLPCVIEPAAKIAVATLARFMAMYFSNQSLFVYPPYNPQPLPRLDSPEKNIDNRRIAVYHDQISVAVRKSDLSGIFTVNLALQLLLVCGLHWEAIWFAKQLGDWKSSLILAVIANEHSALQKKMVKNTALPVDLHPLSIVKENLMHVIHQSQYTAPQQQNFSNNHKAQFKSSPTRLLTSCKKSLSIASLTEADKALHEQLSRSIKEILTAATVAKLDVTPWLLCQLMQKCLAMVAKFDRLVPDDFYLPAPPYFCPQPSLGIEVTYCEAVQDEYELRRETSDIIQLILLVLSASNCTMPCSRWYVQELMKAQEKLIDQDQDTTCDFPTMLASYTTCPVDFKALLTNSDPTRLSTKLLLQCFRDICTIVWLLNVRDKLTMAVRKYRVIQENVCSSLNTFPTFQQKSRSVLQDIIQWSKFLHSFSFFLNMEDEVQDILLTAVSNLPPSKDVAEVLGEVFYSSKIVLPAVEEKFQRVMTKLKKKKEKAHESAEKKKNSSTLTLEPLYVYYRKQCLKQKRSLISKTEILGSVEEQILGIYCTPPKSKETIEKQLSKASTFKVGARSFETNKVFLDFLETFFLVAFGKFDESVSYHGIKKTDNIPLLRSYADEIRQHELSTLAFGIAKPQHCVELSDAVLLRSQCFENLSKSFSLTRSGAHETDGCVPSKIKGLFRSKQSYFFKKKMLPSIELLSTLNNKGAEQEVVDVLEKDERPVSRLSQKGSLGYRKNQSFDDIRAVSRMSSLSSSRVSRSSLTKLRSSKGSLMLGLDGQKLFLDVNFVPGAVYKEMVMVQQWMSRWSKKVLPFDTHSSSETTERAIRVELPQQLLINCMWLTENWYNIEKTTSTDGTRVDNVDGIDQGIKNRRVGVAMRPDLDKENSNVEAKDKMSKSKVTMKKRSKSSQCFEIRSNNIESELKKPDGEDQETKSRISKISKTKRRKFKKSSKTSQSLKIHSDTSQLSNDAFKQKEKEEQEIAEKKLKKSDCDSDEIDEEKIKKSSRLRKQQTREVSTETSLKTTLDALERKHSIPQSPLVSPCASINRLHSDQTIGFRKLVRAELKKLLEFLTVNLF